MIPARVLGAWLLVLIALGFISPWLVAAVVPLDAPRWPVHRYVPLPLACAGFSCITFRSFALQLEAAGGQGDGATLLTDALTARAARILARRAGLTVSEREVDAATETLAALSSSETSLQRFLTLQYGDLRESAFREGMRDILLRRKLAAGGSPTVWDHPLAPAVALFQFRYRWDPRDQRVVGR